MNDEKKDFIEVKMEKTKQELIKSLNDIMNKNNLSFYLFDFIFSEIYDEIKKAKSEEIEGIKKIINNELKEENYGKDTI